MSEKKNMTGKENSFHMENFRRRSRYAAVFLVLILAFAAITVLNINSGNVNISIPEIFRILLRRTGEGKEYNIIWKIRLPRILMAAILGGALSLSGFLLQTFFENPIAGPFVLGISSGAKMVVALTMIFYLEWARNITSYTMIVAAFLGSLLSVGFILLMSRRIKNMAGLLVGGIMIGYICSAVTDFVVTFAEDSDIVNLHGWSQGSFSGMSWSNVAISAAVIGITFVITFLMAKPIGAYQLGEAYAQSMGVNIKVFRIALILLSSILSACVTAFAGPISFVGIAVPFLVKQSLGTSRPLVVIPGTFLGGAVFCMMCDLIARMAFAPLELSISTVTSIFGAPVVIFMMLRRKRGLENMKEYYFHLDHLTVGYDKKPLIKDICIGIEKGEIVTLIGPNGSGKSTILKSITRQLKLVGGNVEFDGKNLHELSFRELSTKMAVVLTERMKPELMTCHDIVATGRYPYTGRLGMLTREDEEKVEKAMRAVHAEELGGRDFNAISDGQRQRVLLARAICQEPEVIILDEPTSFLDIRHKLELLAILRRMAKEKGITVIMSLHEIDLAQKISDKIICVKGDAISHFGAPETIFREDIIRELYEIDNGSFDPCFGSIELPRPEGTPRVFVLAGGGTGIPVFRKLQKENVPFAAGVLYTNDIDYQLARILAMETVTEAPFQEISDEAFARACELMKSCERVIDTGVPVGMCNRRIEELRAEAKRLGKLAE